MNTKAAIATCNHHHGNKTSLKSMGELEGGKQCLEKLAIRFIREKNSLVYEGGEEILITYQLVSSLDHHSMGFILKDRPYFGLFM